MSQDRIIITLINKLILRDIEFSEVTAELLKFTNVEIGTDLVNVFDTVIGYTDTINALREQEK